MTPAVPEVEALANALVATGRQLWSCSHNNTPAAHRIFEWMRAIATGNLVLEVTSPRALSLDRVGTLVKITSSHEYTIRTFDGREHTWENAEFVRIPQSEADTQALIDLMWQKEGS